MQGIITTVIGSLFDVTIFAMLAWAFGATLKLSDLLQEHGFRWFAFAELWVGAVSTAVCASMLLLGHDRLLVFWLAVTLAWILRGRIDGANHGLLAFTILLIGFCRAPNATEHQPAFLYFLIPLTVLGSIHDVLQYTDLRTSRSIEWFFENQHLYWYGLGAGYLVLFDTDWILLGSLFGFVKGYGFFYDERNRALLGYFGIYDDSKAQR